MTTAPPTNPSNRTLAQRAWTPWTVFVGVLAVAMALRFYRIGDRSMWFDESVSWTTVTRFGWTEMIERTSQAVHPPFYYIVLRLWAGIAGDSLVAMRVLSVVLAAVTIVGVYRFCRDAFADQSVTSSREASLAETITTSGDKGDLTSHWTAVAAAALVGASSVHIIWAQEARMYMLGTALAIWSSWLLLRGLASGSRSIWAAYTLTLTAFLYTHNYGLFTAVAHVGYLCGYFLWVAPEARRSVTAWRAGIAVIIAMLLYSPWVPVLFSQADRVQANYWIGPLHGWTVPHAWFDLFVPQNHREPRDPLLVTVVLGLVLAALAVLAVKGRAADRLVVTLVLVPVICAVVLSAAAAPIVVARYFLFAHVFALCGLARAIWLVFSGFARPVLAAVLVANSLAVHVDYWEQLAIADRPGLRGALETVLDQRDLDEPLVIVHPALFHAARYYVADRASVMLYADQPLTHFNGAPLMREGDLLRPDDLVQFSAERLWLIDSTGFRSSFPRFRLPLDWLPQGETLIFPEVHFFQDSILAGRYARRPQSESVTRTP